MADERENRDKGGKDRKREQIRVRDYKEGRGKGWMEKVEGDQ